MDSIGERIKYLRKEFLNKTQKEFGDKIGLKPNSISDIESGKNNPTDQTIKAICREFNINHGWITNGMEPIVKESDADSMARIDDIMNGENEFAKSLFRQFSRLDETEWKVLEKLIKKIAKEIE